MDSVEVSSADIARLAGVRPTAVSNWRRRHSDFPAPVGGTEKSPRFSLDEVREWLAEQGRAVDVGAERAFEQAVSTAAIFTPLADTLRNAMFALINHVGEKRANVQGWQRRLQADAERLEKTHLGLAGTVRIADLDTSQATMLNAAIGAAADRSVSDLADDVYDAVTRRLGTSEIATPAQLADLMVRLAEPGDGPLVDIACGAGSILMAAVRHGCRDVAGIEAAASRAQLAALRLQAAGFDSPERPRLHAGDALVADPFGPGTAAAVAANPPFNDRNWAQDVRDDEPWWEYGIPTARDSELAWVQRALYQLSAEGTAALVMPPAAAASPSGRRIRRRMLSDGVIRAVIALPRGSFHGTAIAPHLWLLNRTSGPVTERTVLTADFSGYTTETQQPDWDRIADSALTVWTAFKSGGKILNTEAKATPVMTLLSDGVDLTPGRYLPLRLPELDLGKLELLRRDTNAKIDALSVSLENAPGPQIEPSSSVRWETFETLAKNTEISLHRGLPSERKPNEGAETIRTVRANAPESEGEAAIEPGQHVPRIREGDLLAAVYGERIWVRQATGNDLDAAPALGTVIIRTDPRQIDPAFLAGFLASELAYQQLPRVSTSTGINSMRELRRIRVPLPDIESQQKYAGLFTSLAAIAADASDLAATAEDLTRAWRDNVWAAIVAGTGPEE